MKKLRGRTWFVLVFTFALVAGMCVLVWQIFTQGGQWAAFSANSHLYQKGRIATGSITDRNGILLYDAESGDYAEERVVRKSTLHAVGDAYGNIASGAKVLFRRYMASYNPVTGTGGGGNRIALTLDAEVNAAAYRALDGRSGTVAVYDYRTGEVLCMVSSPSFDPYDSQAVLEAVNAGDHSYDGVYLNHLLSATFTPGSIFKIVTTAAALERLPSAADFTFHCTGSLELEGTDITCPSAHGEQNLAQALSNSCNCAFAQLSVELGADTLERYAKLAGLLDSLEVNGFTCAAGSYAAPTDAASLGWSGVGQANDLVNPCAELVLMGCIAGEGKAKAPTLLKSVTNDLGLPGAFLPKTGESEIGFKPSTCRMLKQMMRANVTDHYGQAQFGDLPVCAKSGTAEVGPEEQPHAWFVGFVDDSSYPYAFVVLVEHGGWGSTTAGSVAAEVLNALTEGES